jgi:hypothetical protein
MSNTQREAAKESYSGETSNATHATMEAEKYGPRLPGPQAPSSGKLARARRRGDRNYGTGFPIGSPSISPI